MYPLWSEDVNLEITSVYKLLKAKGLEETIKGVNIEWGGGAERKKKEV